MMFPKFITKTILTVKSINHAFSPILISPDIASGVSLRQQECCRVKLLRKKQIQMVAYEPRDWALATQYSSECHSETATRLPLVPCFLHCPSRLHPYASNC